MGANRCYNGAFYFYYTIWPRFVKKMKRGIFAPWGGFTLMASFSESGLNGLDLSLKELIELPDSVAGEMLVAEGRIVAAAQKRSMQGAGLVDSGQLVNSITVNVKVKKKSGTRYITVYPKGERRGKKAAPY